MVGQIDPYFVCSDQIDPYFVCSDQIDPYFCSKCTKIVFELRKSI